MSVEIELNDLINFKLAPGNIFWQRPTGKEVLILEVGDIFNIEDFKKYEKGKHCLKIDWFVDRGDVLLGMDILSRLQSKKFEKEREEIREEFSHYLTETFWNGNKEGSFLSLILITESVFNNLSDEKRDYLISLNRDLYLRSTMVASLNIVFSFISGYLSYDFLEEIYYISFCQDLVETSLPMSEELLQTLEKARLDPIPSQSLFSDLVNGQSLGRLQEAVYQFKIPGVIKLIERVREKIVRGGCPRNLNEEELSDLEKIVILNQEVIPYGKFSFKKSDGVKIINNILKNKDLLSNLVDVSPRVKNIISQQFLRVGI